MAASDTFYNDVKSDVDEIIEEFGTTYTVRAQGSYDADTLETSVGSGRTVTGLVADQQFVRSFGSDSGWTAERTLILTAAAVPLAGEEIQVDGQWFPLSKVMPIKPADVVVVYFLDVTR
jgi:hypothetical protein